MKKAIALLATLVVLTSTTFAQLAPTITGYAETKFGSDLESTANGFELDTSVTVTVPLVTSETVATEGEGATGVASITGSSLTFTFDLDSFDDDDDFLSDDLNDEDSALKGTDADISAKIDFANGAYVTIGSSSDIETNMVSGDQDYWVKPDYDQQEGISLGYAADKFSFEVTVANETEDIGGFAADEEDNATDEDYRGDTDVIAEDKIVNVDEVSTDDTEAEVNDGYVLGAKGMFTLGDMLTIDAAFGTTQTEVASDKSARKYGFAVKATTMPIDGLTITFPFDYLNANNDVAFELMPTVAYAKDAFSASADFHYISVAKELDGGSAVVAEVIPAGYTKVTIDGVVYLTNDSGVTLVLAEDNDDYVAAGDARDAVAGLTEDFTAKALNVTLGYTLDAGKASVTLGTDLADEPSFEVAASWTAAIYSVALDLGDLAYKAEAAKAAVIEDPATLRLEAEDATDATTAGPDDIGLDFGFTGVTGLTASVETTISLDDARDNDATFTVDKINLDFDSAITGLENTVLTVNYSGFNFTDNKGILYVGAKISL